MEASYACETDSFNLATVCCTCTFPLPCICEACKDSHSSKPGAHYFLPLTAKKTIASERDLVKLQRKLHDLTLTHRELVSMLTACQKAREDVEAAYQEIMYKITETRNEYLAQINQTIGEYEQLIYKAMQDSVRMLGKGQISILATLRIWFETYPRGRA